MFKPCWPVLCSLSWSYCSSSRVILPSLFPNTSTCLSVVHVSLMVGLDDWFIWKPHNTQVFWSGTSSWQHSPGFLEWYFIMATLTGFSGVVLHHEHLLLFTSVTIRGCLHYWMHETCKCRLDNASKQHHQQGFARRWPLLAMISRVLDACSSLAVPCVSLQMSPRKQPSSRVDESGGVSQEVLLIAKSPLNSTGFPKRLSRLHD